MTGPDDQRGQETWCRCGHSRRSHGRADCARPCHGGCDGVERCECLWFGPAPQQQPTQEQEATWDHRPLGGGRCVCGQPVHTRAAPPPEADTAGEEIRTEWAAIVMCEKADRWYWAEREICGFATDTESPCVLSPGHDGDHDGTRRATARERLDAWLVHQADHAQDGDERPAVSPAGQDSGPWRVGSSYRIHVYEGDRPVATFHRPEDAAEAVAAVAALRAARPGGDQ